MANTNKSNKMPDSKPKPDDTRKGGTDGDKKKRSSGSGTDKPKK